PDAFARSRVSQLNGRRPMQSCLQYSSRKRPTSTRWQPGASRRKGRAMLSSSLAFLGWVTLLVCPLKILDVLAYLHIAQVLIGHRQACIFLEHGLGVRVGLQHLFR